MDESQVLVKSFGVVILLDKGEFGHATSASDYAAE
jgi:hypothetical protein